MVGARKKGEEGCRREKRGERFCFHKSVFGSGGRGSRKRTEIKTHYFLSFLCPPSLSWTQMPKRDAKGPAFLSFFVFLPLALAAQPGPPPCWAQASEGKRQG